MIGVLVSSLLLWPLSRVTSMTFYSPVVHTIGGASLRGLSTRKPSPVSVVDAAATLPAGPAAGSVQPGSVSKAVIWVGIHKNVWPFVFLKPVSSFCFQIETCFIILEMPNQVIMFRPTCTAEHATEYKSYRYRIGNTINTIHVQLAIAQLLPRMATKRRDDARPPYNIIIHCMIMMTLSCW